MPSCYAFDSSDVQPGGCLAETLMGRKCIARSEFDPRACNCMLLPLRLPRQLGVVPFVMAPARAEL